LNDKSIRLESPVLVLVLRSLGAPENQSRVPVQLVDQLGLNSMKDRNWFIRSVSAETLEGVLEGLTWLTSNLQ